MRILSTLFSTIALACALVGSQAKAADLPLVDDGSASDPEIAYTARTTVLTSDAGPPGPGGPACHGMSFSTEQLEKLAALKNDFLDGIGPKVVQLKSYERHLKLEMAAQDVDKDKVLQLQAKINGLKADLATSRVKFHLDKLALMTPDQRETIRRHMLLKCVFGHHHRGFGSGHFPGPPPGPNFKAELPEQPPAPEPGAEPVEEISGLF